MLNIEFEKIYQTKFLGIVRSLLAIGTLITLLNPITELIPFKQYQERKDGLNLFLEKINIFYLSDYKNLEIAWYISILILILVIIGYFPQITSILHVWISYSVLNSSVIIEGGDQITAIITLLLVPILIFDKRLNQWGKKEILNYSKSKYLIYFLKSVYVIIQVQIAILYLDAAVEKCKSPEWIDGTVIYYWINNNLFGPTEPLLSFLNFIFKYSFLTTAITWSVLILEFLLFAAIFMEQQFKKYILIAGVLFHFFIFLFFGLASFDLAMTAVLLLYLYPFYNIKVNPEIEDNKIETQLVNS